LGLPKEYGIYGSLFYNIGTVYGVENRYKNRVVDEKYLRSAYGISILWQSPMGPLSFDFAKPVRYKDYDETQNFAFNFGGTF
jgi:outer membrane protein insertion porin family